MQLLQKTLLLFLSLFMALSACKKGDNTDKGTDPAPETPPLSRDFSLKYNGAFDETQESFGTLKEDANPTIFNWAGGKVNSTIVHFGLGLEANIPTLYAPDDLNAIDIFNDLPEFNGVGFWPQPVKGLTFDAQAVNDTDFGTLTKESIDAKVPDAGFGGSNVTKINVQQNQLIRFIYRDSNNVLKFKGYIKVNAAGNGNPKTADVTVKYIAK